VHCFFFVRIVIHTSSDLILSSYDDLVTLVRNRSVIDTTNRCLKRIHFLTTYRHGSPRLATAPEHVNITVFLMSYVIAFKPTHVFDSVGPLERDLQDAVHPLLSTFERILQIVVSTGSFQCVSKDLTHDFPTLVFEYLKRFRAWKTADQIKITSRVKHAITALHKGEGTLPPDMPEDHPTRIEFRAQIQTLQTKLQKLIGAEAFAQFDADRRSAIPPAPPPSHMLGNYSDLPGRMTNEQLAHELLLDPAFELNDCGGCSFDDPIHHRIRESFHDAFWGSIADDLRFAVPCFTRVLHTLSEIHDGIVHVATPRHVLAIRETIDIDFIRRQTDAGAFDWDNCKRLVGGVVAIIQNVQAPKRDAETTDQWKKIGTQMLDPNADRPETMSLALKFMLDRVSALRIDAANAR
jgi:hypothetical protein